MKYWPLRTVGMPRRARRTCTPEFKAQVVRDLLTGKRSQAEVCREHQRSPSLVALWKDATLEHLPALFRGEDRLSQEQARIAELEQLAGRQALELEILKKPPGYSLGRRAETGGRYALDRPVPRTPRLPAPRLPALRAVPRDGPTAA
jgi:transposase